MPEITITIELDDLMSLPGEAVVRLLDKGNLSREMLIQAREFENRPKHGKGRWVVNNFLRNKLTGTGL